MMSCGTPCTVNSMGDLYMEYESRDFIKSPCFFIKKTRAGLYQVGLISNPKKVYSVAKYNLDIDNKNDL